MAIFVFSDEQAARVFDDYQTRRQGQLLTAVDYQNLAGIWNRVPLIYVYDKSQHLGYYPARNPNGWWKSR